MALLACRPWRPASPVGRTTHWRSARCNDDFDYGWWRRDTGGLRAATSARVSTGSAQLLFRLTGEGSRARVCLGAGGGAIQHGGSTYGPFGKPVNFGGVFGLGSAIRITGGLSADVGVTSMVYDLNIRGTPQTDVGLRERGRQVDMLMQTGLSYSWH